MATRLWLVGLVALTLATLAWPRGATAAAPNEYTLPFELSDPTGIAAGPDGAMWFTEQYGNDVGQIGRIDPATKAITEYTQGLTEYSVPFGIAAGPDGAMWFTEVEGNQIGRIDPTTKAITEYTQGLTPNSAPTAIAAGPDNAMWFVERDANRIGRIDLTTKAITEYTQGLTPDPNPFVTNLTDIAKGPDNAMWFTEAKFNKIGRIDPVTKAITEYSAGLTAGSFPIKIAAGPDGAMWFTEAEGNRIGRIDPTTKAIIEYAISTPRSAPNTIAKGPDNALWFTETNANKIGRLAPVDLAITVTDGVSTATPGGTVTYTITVANSGPAAITGATVADTFPASLTGVTWTCAGAGGGTCAASGSGNIASTVNLPANGSVTYTVLATVSPAATGTLSNTATVTASSNGTDTNASNDSATDSDTLTPQADLSITKTDGATTATPGTAITYTIVAANAGPSNVTGATVADTFPASLTGVTWTCAGAGGGTCAASGSGNIASTVNLPRGGSVIYTARATIDPQATGTLSNTATIAPPPGVNETNPANNSATDSDTLLSNVPTATNDAYTVAEGATLTVAAPGVLGNDTTPSGTLTASLVTGPARGALTLNTDGSFTYTPVADFSGTDTFTYRANNGAYDSNTATVTLTVNPINRPPLPVVRARAEGGGVISPPGDTIYPAGSQATYIATPTAGQLFLGWTLDGQRAGYSSPLTFRVDADRTLVARFAPRPSFSDVPASSVAWDAITQLAARGIINGYGDGTYGPTDNVQRAQIAALIVRALGFDGGAPGGPAPFSDLGLVDPELQRAIVILTQRGIAKGYPDGTFNPTGDVTHAQAISLIARSMVQAGYWTSVTAAEDDGTIYPNIPASSPHRLDILTYVKYAGAIPDRPTTQAWQDWEGSASRGWTAQVLWAAYASAFGIDRVP